MPGGRERTAEEFRALFDRAGFELTRIVPTPVAAERDRGTVRGWRADCMATVEGTTHTMGELEKDDIDHKPDPAELTEAEKRRT